MKVFICPLIKTIEMAKKKAEAESNQPMRHLYVTVGVYEALEEDAMDELEKTGADTEQFTLFAIAGMELHYAPMLSAHHLFVLSPEKIPNTDVFAVL
jgi:hypothetical protein